MTFIDKLKARLHIEDHKDNEWISAAVDEMDRLLRDYETLHSPGVKFSFSEVDDDDEARYSTVLKPGAFNEWQREASKPSFQQLLLTHLRNSGMTNPQFYKAAFIDRKLFSAMISNSDYKPSKDTAVACCFGLKLSLEESKELLAAAGYDLSMSIQRDRAIYYCLGNKIYDLNKVNELLHHLDEKCIGV